MPTLPRFNTLLQNYPQGSPGYVKSTIGGHVNSDDFTNTCTIRLSRALNYSGVPLPKHFAGLNVAGSDKKWYAYRVKGMERWLQFRFGAPDKAEIKPKIKRADFADKQGIIAFDIHFGDATGHVDLWDGSAYIHEAVDRTDYFTLASEVRLWIAP